MATLTGSSIASTYDQLLSLPSGGGGGTTLKAITDGDATTTFCLQLSTTKALIEGNGSTLYFYDEGGEYIKADNSGKLTIAAAAEIEANTAIFDLNATGDVSIDSTGNINLTSTANEANSVYIRENAGTSGTIKIHADQGTGADSISLVSDGGGITMTLGGGAGDDFIVDTSTLVVASDTNTVGIGTTGPTAPLHIASSTDAITLLCENSSTASAGRKIFHFSGTSGAGGADGDLLCVETARTSGSDEFNLFRCITDTADVFNVRQSGKVGIGITAPESLCHIKNTADTTSSTVHVLQVEDSHSTIDAGDVLARFDYSGDANVHSALAKFISFHDSGGEIGYIATSSDGVISVDILGSDVRLKTDIQDTSLEGLNIINALKIRDFKWSDKANPNLTGKQMIGGWVADEVYEVYPKAVHGTPGQMMDVKDDNGDKTGEKVMNPMGLSASQFISVMMKAIQELSTSNDALKARIEVLEAA